MASLCKLPNLLSLTGNIAQNWREFEEQLKWYLAGKEADKKPDLAKIHIMLSHVARKPETSTTSDKNKFDKVLEAFQRYCFSRKNISYGFWTIQQEQDETADVYLTRMNED